MLTFTTLMPCNMRIPPTLPVPTRVRILNPALPTAIMVRMTIIRKIILLTILIQASHLIIAAILPAPAVTRSKTRIRTVLRNHLQAMTTSRAVNQVAKMTSNNPAPRNLPLSHQPNLRLLNPTLKVVRLESKRNKHHSSSLGEKWCFFVFIKNCAKFKVKKQTEVCNIFF